MSADLKAALKASYGLATHDELVARIMQLTEERDYLQKALTQAVNQLHAVAVDVGEFAAKNLTHKIFPTGEL